MADISPQKTSNETEGNTLRDVSTETASSNSRIARNALMLYIRMFLTMIVGLYTSRVVLNVLGVEDYGIYGVVGGVVAMLGFLNASMSGATSRFLTFELGRGDQKRLADTFSSALIVHIGIAVIVLIVAETVGLWFLNHKLVIPESRMPAAHWVYQCSIISAMLNITQVPYNAAIIAHEKMDVYAYVEILNVTLKLLIVYLLTIGNFDKLILYAILVLAVSALIMMVYRIYCLRHFQESQFHFVWDKSILKPLLSFSGWDLYGNICLTTRQQGIQFLVNMFFGVVYNAASHVASTVMGVILQLSHNITLAFRPQIIKLYSIRDFVGSVSLINKSCKFSTLLLCVFCVPLFFNVDTVLNVWLVEPPRLASLFCQIYILTCLLNMLCVSLQIGIHATGDIKTFSFLTGCCHLCTIPFIYVLYRLNFEVQYAFYVSVIMNGCNLLIDVILAKKKINSFSIYDYLTKTIFPVLLSISSIVFLLLMVHYYCSFEQSLLKVCVDSLLTVIVLVILGLSRAEKRQLIRFVHSKVI